MSIEEQKLIEGCKKGDRKCQKQLYEMFAPKMLGVCFRYTNSKDLAQDVLHDGFIKVLTHFKSYTGSGSLEGWIRRVIVNTALESLRKSDALKKSIDIEGCNDNVIVNADVSIISKLTACEILDVIMQLPVGYRTVFNLFAIEGYSHKEIGEFLGIGESSSRSQYVRAKQMLQKKINASSGTNFHQQYSREPTKVSNLCELKVEKY